MRNALPMAWGDPLDRSDDSHDLIDDPRDGDLASLPPEHLRCPNCDYGVFGLPESRCPECGRSFSWEQVRTLALRLRSRLFEHRWRDDPAASLLHTFWLAAFRPRKLWGSYDRGDPPRLWPLIILVLLQWLLFGRGWHTLAFVIEPSMNYLAALAAGSGQNRLRFTYVFRPGSMFLADLAMWQIATFAALQLFFQSKHRCRVGWKHILRVFVHATAFASFAPVLWFIFELLVDVSLFIRPARITISVYNGIGFGVLGLVVLVTWAHLWLGYRRHLKMPHGWAVGGLSMLLGFLMLQVLRLFV